VLQYLTAVFITSWRDVILSDELESGVRVDEVGSVLHFLQVIYQISMRRQHLTGRFVAKRSEMSI